MKGELKDGRGPSKCPAHPHCTPLVVRATGLNISTGVQLRSNWRCGRPMTTEHKHDLKGVTPCKMTDILIHLSPANIFPLLVRLYLWFKYEWNKFVFRCHITIRPLNTNDPTHSCRTQLSGSSCRISDPVSFADKEAALVMWNWACHLQMWLSGVAVYFTSNILSHRSFCFGAEETRCWRNTV